MSNEKKVKFISGPLAGKTINFEFNGNAFVFDGTTYVLVRNANGFDEYEEARVEGSG